jgi:two-component system cell cycle response regulator
VRVTLRLKFTLALLLSCLAVVAVVGGVARWMLLRDLGQIVLEDTFLRFRQDVADYFAEYDSWSAGQKKEAFPDFVHRRHMPLGPGPAGMSGGPPPGPGEPGGGPPPELFDPYGAPPPEGSPGGPRFAGPPGGPGAGPPGRPGSPPPGGQGPPPRFLLFDPRGKVLLGAETYAEGSQVPDDVKAKAARVMLRGRVVAWAVPVPNAQQTILDSAYLDSVHRALAVAAAVACVLALGLGISVGSRLGGRLRRLTEAIEATGDGQLGTQLRESSTDEVGTLVGAFNRMSSELARAQGELQRSSEEIRAQAEQLKELSIRDPLTGLYNRRYFDQHAALMFAQARRYSHRLCIALIDLDHFKRVNDRFSHAVGDEVLRRVAGLLAEGVRESDLLARYGGEELVVAFYQCSSADAAAVCERLRRSVEEHSWREVHPDLRVTLSVGLSGDSLPGTPEELLGEADLQLYRAKGSGRNRVCLLPPPSVPAVTP